MLLLRGGVGVRTAAQRRHGGSTSGIWRVVRTFSGSRRKATSCNGGGRSRRGNARGTVTVLAAARSGDSYRGASREVEPAIPELFRNQAGRIPAPGSRVTCCEDVRFAHQSRCGGIGPRLPKQEGLLRRAETMDWCDAGRTTDAGRRRTGVARAAASRAVASAWPPGSDQRTATAGASRGVAVGSLSGSVFPTGRR
jgi:hypothetical protein